MPAPLNFVLDGEKALTVTRRFEAPPALVYRAHTEPALVQRWMFGPPGWTMPVCEMDVRPGGVFRHDFVGPEDARFTIEGHFLELDPGRRILHVERMLLPDPTPDNRIESRFEPDGDGTRLVLHMTLPDAASRTAMLDTGMTDGMETSYQGLDRLIADGLQ